EALLALRADRAGRFGIEGLESAVPAVRRAAEQARVASQTAASVLIVGEPGSGRQWLARAVHQLGPRRDEPFAALDCSRLPAEALREALFGDGGLLSPGAAGTLY